MLICTVFHDYAILWIFFSLWSLFLNDLLESAQVARSVALCFSSTYSYTSLHNFKFWRPVTTKDWVLISTWDGFWLTFKGPYNCMVIIGLWPSDLQVSKGNGFFWSWAGRAAVFGQAQNFPWRPAPQPGFDTPESSCGVFTKSVGGQRVLQTAEAFFTLYNCVLQTAIPFTTAPAPNATTKHAKLDGQI